MATAIADAADIEPLEKEAAAGHPRIDILLIQPPIRDFYLTAKRTQPYGLFSIAACLKQRGYRVAVCDGLARSKSRRAAAPDALADCQMLYGPQDHSPFGLFGHFRHFGLSLATIGEKARLSGAFLFGISALFSAYEDMALATAQTVKAACPDVPVVLGGHHATALPERLLAHPAVDFVLRGDGEATLPHLLRALQTGAPLAAVPGLGLRNPDGRLHINPPAFVLDLNRLPAAAQELSEQRFYARRGQRTLVITASRGCPMQCSYCCTGANAQMPYRRRRIEHIMREIERQDPRQTIGFIDFEDENLAHDPRWFRDLLRAITRAFNPPRPELRAMNGLFPPTLDDELIGLMRQAGFKSLNLSLASTDPQQLRRFRRPDVRTSFDRVLQTAAAHGMDAVAYLIAGAPFQDPARSVHDLLFLARRRVLAGLSVFYPAPGSHDFALCAAQRCLPREIIAWRATALPLNHTTTRLESVTLLRLARILNFMKACLDRDGRLPMPRPIEDDARPPTSDRRQLGKRLLQAFFFDGIIRGVSADGRLFVPPTAASLVASFLQGLAGMTLRGVASASSDVIRSPRFS